MLRYAITDGDYGRQRACSALLTGYSSLEQSARVARAREALSAQVRRLAFEGVEFFQVREKNLEAGYLVALVRELQQRAGTMKILVNTRVDVAIATGAAGVHLGARPGELTAAQVRHLFAQAGLHRPVISKACHTPSEVRAAGEDVVELILFSPVFDKTVSGIQQTGGVGLERLRQACHAADGVPALALGGVTPENTRECLAAGAAGVAGIRRFACSTGQ